MATVIRPELSEKNKYWVERHRYYELKHFCLQYPIWKKSYLALDSLSKKPAELVIFTKGGSNSDPTSKCAIAKAYYSDRIELLERIADETDSELASYILAAVTEGYSYEYFKSRLDIPCCRDTYYDRYRRFFWLLNKTRD